MPVTVENIDGLGPLAALDQLCDAMELLLDPGRRWYPVVEDHLRMLDYAIRWEMDRLRWEVEFAESLARDEEKARAKSKKPRRLRSGAKARAAEDRQQARYDPEP